MNTMSIKTFFRKSAKIFFVLILGIALGIAAVSDAANIRVEFCRDFISCGGGLAGIAEGDSLTCIFKIDEKNNECSGVFSFNLNFITNEVITFDELIEGDSGEIYALASVYGANSVSEQRIYFCDFERGILKKTAELLTPSEEWKHVARDQVTARDGRFYYILANEANQAMACSIDTEGGFKQEALYNLPADYTYEQCCYTEYGAVFKSSINGIYFGETDITPIDGYMLSGLIYKDGKISTADFNSGRLLTISLPSMEIVLNPIYLGEDRAKIQNIRAYTPTMITASIENGGLLNAYSLIGGERKVYENIRLSNLVRIFFIPCIGVWVVGFAVIGITKLAKQIVYWLTPKNKRHKRGFTSVTSKISNISLAAAAVFVAILFFVIYDMLDSDFDYWTEENTMLASSCMAANFNGLKLINTDGGKFELANEYRAEYNQVIKRMYLSENHFETKQDRKRDYMVLSKNGDEAVCILSQDFSSSISAVYAVSLRMLDYCEKAMEEGQPYFFNEYRTTGKYNVGVMPVMVKDMTGTDHSSAAVAVINSYFTQAEKMKMLPQLMLVLSGCCVLIIVVLNVLIRFFLRRVKRLRAYIDNTKNTSVIGGGDEIAYTASALKTMSDGLNTYVKNINSCNGNYGKLYPKDLIGLITDKSVENIDCTEQAKFDMIFIKLISDSAGTVFSGIKRFCDENNGVVIEYEDSGVLFGCKDDGGIPKLLLSLNKYIPKEDYKLIIVCRSETEAFVAGNGKVKKPVIYSEGIRYINRAEKSDFPPHSILICNKENTAVLDIDDLEDGDDSDIWKSEAFFRQESAETYGILNAGDSEETSGEAERSLEALNTV